MVFDRFEAKPNVAAPGLKIEEGVVKPEEPYKVLPNASLPVDILGLGLEGLRLSVDGPRKPRRLPLLSGAVLLLRDPNRPTVELFQVEYGELDKVIEGRPSGKVKEEAPAEG